jgi:hypothetical protein
MSAVVEQEHQAVNSPTSGPVAMPSPARQQQAAAHPESPSTGCWAGDRIALVVWLMGATIMAALLLRDLVFAFVPN